MRLSADKYYSYGCFELLLKLSAGTDNLTTTVEGEILYVLRVFPFPFDVGK